MSARKAGPKTENSPWELMVARLGRALRRLGVKLKSITTFNGHVTITYNNKTGFLSHPSDVFQEVIDYIRAELGMTKVA
jgi:hypothetical protein